MNNRVDSSLRENQSISLELDTVVYLEAFTSRNKTGLSMCYKEIKSLSNCTDIPLEVTWDDATASGYDQVAKLFNLYFVSVYNKPSKRKVFEQPVENGLDSLEFTQEENSSALKNASSGNGPDNIPGELLQCLTNELSPHVTVLFNHILKTGIFPKHWKQSYVTPLYKQGSRNCVSSYRLINGKLSLALDRLTFDKLYQLLKMRYLLNSLASRNANQPLYNFSTM